MDNKLQMYHRLMKFAKNTRPKDGYSNLYVLQLIDHETNVVEEEYYGMNHMTDYGFDQYAALITGSVPKNLFIGCGEMNSADFRRSNAKLLQVLSYTPAVVTTSTIDYDYPLYFDKKVTSGNTETGSDDITAVCRYMVATVPYYEPGYTCTISEYGLGDPSGPNSQNNNSYLWTHSRIYDETGAIKQVQKKISQDLVITVFLCIVFNKSIIEEGWDRGIFSVITTPARFAEEAMYGTRLCSYRRNDEFTSITGFSENNIAKNTNVNLTDFNGSAMRSTSSTEYARVTTLPYDGFIINKIASASTLDSGYSEGFIHRSKNGYQSVTPIELSTAKEFRYPVKMIFDNWRPEGLSDNFGMPNLDSIPITQLNSVTGVYLFNAKTREYDNSVSYNNDPNHHYNETTMQCEFAEPLHYTATIGNEERLTKLYVHQNLHVDDPILTFDNNESDMVTIIATDSYWDKTTFNGVIKTERNTMNHYVNGVEKSYRYYLTTSNIHPLKPIRASSLFSLGTQSQTIPWFQSNVVNGFDGAVCDNKEKNWFIYNDKIYFIQSGQSISIPAYENNLTSYFTYGNILMVLPHSTTATLYDTTTGLSLSRNIVDIVDNSSLLDTEVYKTENGLGWVCLQSITQNNATVIKLNEYTQLNLDANHLIKITDAKYSCMVWGTKNVAYIKETDNVNKLYIHNLETDTIVNECFVSTSSATQLDITDLTLMLVGHGDYVYLITKNGSNSPLTHYLQISDTSQNYLYETNYSSGETSTSLLFSTFSTSDEGATLTYQNAKKLVPFIETSHVDDAFVIYNFKDTHRISSCLYYMDMANHPTIAGAVLSGWMTDIPINSGSYHSGTRKYFRLRYIHNHTLVLFGCSGYGTISSLSSVTFGVCDFGKLLNVHYNMESESTEFDLPENEQGIDLFTKRIETNHPGYLPCGEYFVDISQRKIVPIEYALKHLLAGTTKTVCTMGKPIILRNKCWVNYFTNVSSEFPPGIKQ